METTEAYDVLELSPPVSDEEVNEAFRTLTKKYHPDVSNGDTREQWIRIYEAKKTLLAQRQRSRQTDSHNNTTTTRQTARTAADETGEPDETENTEQTDRAAGANERERTYGQNDRGRQRRTKPNASQNDRTVDERSTHPTEDQHGPLRTAGSSNGFRVGS